MALARSLSFLPWHSVSFSSPDHRLRSQFLLRPHSLRSDFAKLGASLSGSVAGGGGASVGKLRGNEDVFRSSDDVALGSTFKESDQENDSVPTPIVMIDQDADPDSTVVWLSFGNRLGSLLDTMQALRNLGLDVTKETVATEDSSIKKTGFFITQHGRKVDDPSMLENIRLTIIDNLLQYHPESSERLAMGEAFGIIPPKKPDVDASTIVHVEDDGPKKSLLYIETVDRPGLLLEIIKIVTDVNIDVKSAEISTEGLVAKDKFHVSYGGAALPATLSQVVVNTLRYYLSRPETEDESY